jgi:DNA-binding NarL/FixJ family response regulator
MRHFKCVLYHSIFVAVAMAASLHLSGGEVVLGRSSDGGLAKRREEAEGNEEAKQAAAEANQAVCDAEQAALDEEDAEQFAEAGAVEQASGRRRKVLVVTNWNRASTLFDELKVGTHRACHKSTKRSDLNTSSRQERKEALVKYANGLEAVTNREDWKTIRWPLLLLKDGR